MYSTVQYNQSLRFSYSFFSYSSTVNLVKREKAQSRERWGETLPSQSCFAPSEEARSLSVLNRSGKSSVAQLLSAFFLDSSLNINCGSVCLIFHVALPPEAYMSSSVRLIKLFARVYFASVFFCLSVSILALLFLFPWERAGHYCM